MEYRDIEEHLINPDEIGRVKPSRFSQQSEYRLRVIEPEKKEHIIFSIGDIRDLVKVDTFENFCSQIKVGFKEF